MMKIFSNLPRILTPAVITIPIVNSLYRLFERQHIEYDDDGTPIKLRRVDNIRGSHPVYTPCSKEDAERLANKNLRRMFREAIESHREIQKGSKKPEELK